MLMINEHTNNDKDIAKSTTIQAASQLVDLLLAQVEWNHNISNNKIEIKHDQQQ